MSKYKAVFFDWDNTLTCNSEETYKKYCEIEESLSKKKFIITKDKMFNIFDKIKAKGYNANTYENEVLFYKEYYKQLLIDECGCYNEIIEESAKELFSIMWLKERTLFDDVIETFKIIKSKGLKIGIISDTTHSLQKTLEVLGLGEYIDTYTCSKEVGVMKPNPEIYLAAVNKLDLKPSECIYVDDYDEEVEGAEKLGFKAFRISRKKENLKCFDIGSLKEILKII